jgi:site-specific recombinase XerD
VSARCGSAGQAGGWRALGRPRVRAVAAAAKLELSAHTLRHTCLTGLVRRGNDLVMVAELAGHQKLETTRRYGPTVVTEQERTLGQ